MDRDEREENGEGRDRLLFPEGPDKSPHEEEEPEGTTSPGPSTGALEEAEERGDVSPDPPDDSAR